MDPDNLDFYSAINWFSFKRDGNTLSARELIEQAPVLNKPQYEVSRYIKYWAPLMLDIFDGNYQHALEFLSSIPWDGKIDLLHYYPKSLLKAWIYNLMNLQNKSKIQFDSSRIQLQEHLLDLPDEPRILSALGVAFAGLGNKTKALEYGIKAVELSSLEKDALTGLFRVDDLAWIYTLLEEYAKALEQIKILLTHPGPFSGPLLKLDPKYKPLWDHPEFIQLTELYD